MTVTTTSNEISYDFDQEVDGDDIVDYEELSEVELSKTAYEYDHYGNVAKETTTIPASILPTTDTANGGAESITMMSTIFWAV